MAGWQRRNLALLASENNGKSAWRKKAKKQWYQWRSWRHLASGWRRKRQHGETLSRSVARWQRHQRQPAANRSRRRISEIMA